MKKSARFVTGIALLILMLLLTSAFALCENASEQIVEEITLDVAECPRDKHVGTWKIAIDSTCTTEGQMVLRCDICYNHIRETLPPKGHAYSNPTCTEPGRCVNGCNQIDVDHPALGHTDTFYDASCFLKGKCYRCNQRVGPTLPHNFSEATCVKVATCSYCGTTSGVLGTNHKYNTANCVTYTKCTLCGSLGPLGTTHSYNSATCTTPKMCRLCNITVGSALGHNWVDNGTTVICSRCGSSRLKKPARQ